MSVWQNTDTEVEKYVQEMASNLVHVWKMCIKI